MKKLIITFGIILVSILFFSCEKEPDYTYCDSVYVANIQSAMNELANGIITLDDYYIRLEKVEKNYKDCRRYAR